MALSSKAERIARKFSEKLESLGCPLTEGVEESWINELIFHPGEHRIRLLQWLFACFDSRLNDVLDPKFASVDTKMDSRIQRLLFVSSSLGLCGPNDADLIRGNTTAGRQVAFMDHLLDVVCIMDTSRDSPSMAMHSPGAVSPSMSLDEQFAQDVAYLETLAREERTADLFRTEAKLLPADISKQLDLLWLQGDKKKEKESPMVPKTSQLEEQASKFAEDLQRQLEMLEELKKKYDLPAVDATTREKVNRTLRLVLSETSQVVAGFSYCFDNEMKPWCNRSAAQKTELGPAFKRVHGVLQHFHSILDHIESIKHSHKEVNRKRDVIRKIADKEVRKQNGNQSLENLQEFIDVLEESLARHERTVDTTALDCSTISQFTLS